MGKLGLVIPFYNTAIPLLQELASSLVDQFQDGDQIVWVDDASPSIESLNWLDHTYYQNSLHRIVRLKSNLGVAGAINTGSRMLDHVDYFFCIGSDDVFTDGYIKAARLFLDEHSEYQIVVPKFEMFGARNTIIDPAERDFRLLQLFRRNKIPAASMVRKQLWDRLGGYDATLRGNYEDWDFWFRAAASGSRFYRLNKLGYRYRISPNSLSNRISFKKARRALWRRWIVMMIRRQFMILRPGFSENEHS